MPQTSNISWINSVSSIFFMFVLLILSLNYYTYLGFQFSIKFPKSKFLYSFFL